MDYSDLTLSVTSANLLAASMAAKLLSYTAFEAAVRVNPVTQWTNRSAKVDSLTGFSRNAFLRYQQQFSLRK